MSAGRTSTYKPELATLICERIASGATLRVLDAEDGMPSMPTIMRWARDNEAFREQYARAMEQRADFWAEELLEIADDGKNDYMTRTYGEMEVEVPNPEVIARSKLRVETRKWLMGKAAPKKYSEKIALTDPNDPTLPAVIRLKIDNS